MILFREKPKRIQQKHLRQFGRGGIFPAPIPLFPAEPPLPAAAQPNPGKDAPQYGGHRLGEGWCMLPHFYPRPNAFPIPVWPGALGTSPYVPTGQGHSNTQRPLDSGQLLVVLFPRRKRYTQTRLSRPTASLITILSLVRWNTQTAAGRRR